MNTLPIQLTATGNAATDAAARSRAAESGDGETSFRDVLRGEVAERSQAEANVQPKSGKVEKAAPKTRASAALEASNAVQEKEDTEPAAASTDPADIAQFLVLTSQYSQPVADSGANAAAVAGDAAATEAVGAAVPIMTDVPVIAAADAKLPDSPLSSVQPADVASSRLQAGTATPAETPVSGEKPDFATQLDQAGAAQQPIAGAVPGKGMQQGVAEALAPAPQSAESVSEVQQQPAASFVALQQAGVEHAEKPADPSENRITPRVATTAWNQAIGQKIVWMASNEQQSASLSLNPPDLGPLQVVIRVSESMATANFVSAHPEVRQALEAAMPRLREMLGEAGIQLGQAHVGAGTSGEYGARAQQELAQPAFGGVEASFSLQQDVPQAVQVMRRGLVDTFA